MPVVWYDSYAKALARVERLRREYGVWPGIVGPHCEHMGCPRPARCRFVRSHRDEWRWRLTFNPPDITPAQFRGFID